MNIEETNLFIHFNLRFESLLRDIFSKNLNVTFSYCFICRVHFGIKMKPIFVQVTVFVHGFVQFLHMHANKLFLRKQM